ncbi:MAG: CAP domain-containing protein [Acidobacteriaceae bacterium]
MALLAALGIGKPAFSQEGRSIAAAREIFTLTNQDRQAQGLQPLAWNDALAGAARAHATLMAQEPQLSHQYPGEPPLLDRAAAAGAHFQAIAENVAMAPNAEAVEHAWMNSTPHRTNILDPKMNALGVGVVERGGYLYAVEDFAQAQQALDMPRVEQRVRQLLHAQNIDASLAAGAAEQACPMDHSMPAGTGARSIVRFETPDLSHLPPAVMQQIRSGGFTRAAVGACAPLHNNPAFTTYRVAILLY